MTSTEWIETEAYPLDSLDRIGAGDAFAAGILLGYSEGLVIGSNRSICIR